MPTPRHSYVLRGTCYKADGSTILPNANIMVVNQKSGEIITTTANSSGKYLIDCNNFVTYSNGDSLEVFGYTDLISRHLISSLTTATTKEYRFTVDYTFTDKTVGNSIVPTAGLNLLRDWITGQAPTAPTHMAWGTGTTAPAAGDTTLEGEDTRNALSSESNKSDYVYKIIGILAKTDSNGEVITKSGVFNASSGGTLLGETLLSPISKTATFLVQESDNFIIL